MRRFRVRALTVRERFESTAEAAVIGEQSQRQWPRRVPLCQRERQGRGTRYQGGKAKGRRRALPVHSLRLLAVCLRTANFAVRSLTRSPAVCSKDASAEANRTNAPFAQKLPVVSSVPTAISTEKRVSTLSGHQLRIVVVAVISRVERHHLVTRGHLRLSFLFKALPHVHRHPVLRSGSLVFEKTLLSLVICLPLWKMSESVFHKMTFLERYFMT